MSQVDVKIKIVSEIDLETEKFTDEYLVTNATRSGAKEILEEFLRMQMGKGADDRPYNKVTPFEIEIGVDLQDDTFYSSSNIGNMGLRDGIIMGVLAKIDTIEIREETESEDQEQS